MDLTALLDELARLLAEAKPRAFGAGAVIDRDAAAALLERMRAALPEQLHQAHGVLAERDILIANASTTAGEILAAAQAQATAYVQDHEITRIAEDRARQVVAAAHQEANRKAAEVDAYVDGKLASFEGLLQRTLEAVSHGRQRLAGAAVDAEPR